jgi:hypothetical protein
MRGGFDLPQLDDRDYDERRNTWGGRGAKLSGGCSRRRFMVKTSEGGEIVL